MAPIRERLYRETVGRYGFRKEFAGADAETMMEVLKEIKQRLVLFIVLCPDVYMYGRLKPFKNGFHTNIRTFVCVFIFTS